MKPTGLFQYFHKHRKAFRHYLDRSRAGNDMEDLHQLRVAIKKLKATLSLIEIISQGKLSKKPHYDLIKTFYGDSGKLREAQVTLAIIEEQDDELLQPFAQHLFDAQSHAEKKLHAALNDFDLKNFDKLDDKFEKQIQGMSNAAVFKDSTAYVLKKMRKVIALRKGEQDVQTLHKIRKHLKEATALQTINLKINPAPKLKALHKKIIALNFLIGTWHDYTVLIPWLKDFLNRQTGLKKKQILAMDRFVSQMERKQTASEKKIRKRLDKYLTPRLLEQIQKNALPS